ncbi:MAG: hypothetical protein WAN35_10445 [Terracidiphilus sp.]
MAQLSHLEPGVHELQPPVFFFPIFAENLSHFLHNLEMKKRGMKGKDREETPALGRSFQGAPSPLFTVKLWNCEEDGKAGRASPQLASEGRVLSNVVGDDPRTGRRTARIRCSRQGHPEGKI